MTATVITGWTAISAYGYGAAAFADGLAGGPARLTEAPPGTDLPPGGAFLVPDFDLRGRLGRKGTKAMDRGTGLALTAVADLIERTGGDIAQRADTGLVLGTSFGSTESMMEFTRQSLTGERPWFVDPALMPYGVMNATAGQCAIWHGLRGPNATLAGGRGTALLGLRYARRLLRNNRAARVLTGAVEDYSRARAWLWEQRPEAARDEAARGGAARGEAALGEAAVMLLVEPAGGPRPALAEVLTVESRHALDGSPAVALADCVRSALKFTGVEPDQVALVSTSGAGELETVGDLLGGRARVLPVLADLVGETAAVSAALQVAAVLVEAPGHRGQIALVTSVDTDGPVACALLRLADV
ncbi:beta-ketoacyl synthase N-terminal-like domain-containing protein [Actinoplanes missouriensis]|uniref:beta-ketoacyl synthase N-terminal-like domain-containing protein n=1 Tax=Actinoplanes missouriensis TaxID=1866 RepID=UPI0033CF0DD4